MKTGRFGREMTARYPGECRCCGRKFPAGAAIAYNGAPMLMSCVVEFEAEEKAESERYRQDHADFLAGLRVRVTGNEHELVVTGAVDGKMARAAAEAFVASVTAATGTLARLLGHKRNGKRYVGRELVTYYGMSGLGYHEGWAFPWRMAA